MKVIFVDGSRMAFTSVISVRYVNNQVVISHEGGSKIFNSTIDLISEINITLVYPMVRISNSIPTNIKENN
jgi:hypothetical protein